MGEMEFYNSPDEDEVGIVEIDGTRAIVLVTDDSAFTENSPMEVVEGAENVYVLVRRGVIEAASRRIDGETLGQQVLDAAVSTLATWKVLSSE